MFDLNAYLPILLMFGVAAGFAGGNILLSSLVGQRKRTRTKQMPYECGKDPVGTARDRFSVKFYLIAMIFILFDIELIFLIPWAVVYRDFLGAGLRTLIYVEMMLFVILLLAGYFYVWRKGLFDWGDTARVEAEAEARAMHEAEELARRAREATAARAA
ncbi:MAG TPA: NADH-quinone oxidoreductase subunit A [Pyrinomonadaceae bacterium]|nr:NADH-quinone oxidoreductase subunit A [Pyrinomonadaceae bacterium]